GGGGGAAAGIATPFDWHPAEGRGQPAPVDPQPDGPANRLAALDHDATGLMLRWADGAEQRLADRDLRLACACAKCRDEMSGKPLLDPASVPLDIALTRVWSVGNYALGLAFSDGHDTGIYTFTALRAMQGSEMEDV
ncbi:DUF971 domain-containing protein, partial [Salibaculum halophilum]|uniref:DUF971 domain-containing protein n=1 Tax=Salibaculum halophilum TaxID=1914408 RepID=UPI00117AEF13